MLLHKFSVFKAHLLSFLRCVRDEMGQETDMLVQQHTSGRRNTFPVGTYPRANRVKNKVELFQSALQLMIWLLVYVYLLYPHVVLSCIMFVGCEEPTDEWESHQTSTHYYRYAKYAIITIIMAPQQLRHKQTTQSFNNRLSVEMIMESNCIPAFLMLNRHKMGGKTQVSKVEFSKTKIK